MSPRQTIIGIGIVAGLLVVMFPTWEGAINGPGLGGNLDMGFDANLDLGVAPIFHPPTPAIPKMAGPGATVAVWIDWSGTFWNLAVTVASVAFALRIDKAIRQKQAKDRRARGLCAQCGYDLRGTPRRCPECGLETGG
jgi:hypothetical protein